MDLISCFLFSLAAIVIILDKATWLHSQPYILFANNIFYEKIPQDKKTVAIHELWLKHRDFLSRQQRERF